MKISQPYQTRCHLRVINGIHADASCEVRDELLTVGSDRAGGVTLLDDGLADQHLTFHRLNDNSLQVVALAEGVTIDGIVLAPESSRVLTAPATIQVGTVILEVVYEKTVSAKETTEGESSRPGISKIVSGKPFLCVALIGIILGGFFLRIVGKSASFARPEISQNDHKKIAQNGIDAVPKPVLNDQELGRDVTFALRAAHITGIDIAVMDSVVTLRGEVLPAQWNNLEKVEQWFDRRYGQRYVLLPEVKKAIRSDFSFPIQSVWDGPDANIVVHGEKYSVGSEIRPGYRIASIGNGSIVITHQGGNSIFPY